MEKKKTSAPGEGGGNEKGRRRCGVMRSMGMKNDLRTRRATRLNNRKAGESVLPELAACDAGSFRSRPWFCRPSCAAGWFCAESA